MIFLLVYDRLQGKLLSDRSYSNAELDRANADRLDFEIEHAANNNIEIVILQSKSLEQLKQTHGRYFGDVAALTKAIQRTTAAS